MKINWNEKLLDMKNMPVKDRNGEVTLGDCAVECLMSITDAEKGMAGKERYDLYRLAMKIEKEPKSDFSVDELAKIKDHIGRKTLTLLVGRAYDIIEAGSGSSKDK